MTSFDVIVIGAGHNGMTAATLLARSGWRVLVVEAASGPGGMAVGAELAPGFTVPSVAHALEGLGAGLIAELGLERHGLRFADGAMQAVSLVEGGDPLVLSHGCGPVASGLPDADRERWDALRKRLVFQSSILKRFIATVPPQPDQPTLALKAEAVKAGAALKRAGSAELREFLRMALMPVADVLDEAGIEARLAGMLAFDATLGIAVGPRSPTSILGLYYRLACQAEAGRVPIGGVGAVMEAFHGAATSEGAEFRFDTPVRTILLEQGKAVGIVTAGGEEVRAGCILSAISPVATFNDLVGPRHLDTGFARDIRAIRTLGNVSKLNLALDKRPSFAGAGPTATRLVHAPSVDVVEGAFNPSKYGELPEEPCFEAVLSSVDDPTAPDGAAWLSVAVQNTPHALRSGWDGGREQMTKAVLAVLERASPGIGKSIIASEFLAPSDIEALCHAPGGHWHHGEWQVDRLFFNRPVFGAAHYRAPIDGLYLCGAGTHPGGGINGLSGLNAAKEMMRGGR